MLSLCVGWSDTILTVKILPEEKYLAAVTVCSYIYWLIDCFGYFASIGAQALISRYAGAGQLKRANEILSQSLLIAVLIGLLLLKVMWLSTEFVGVLMPISTSTQQLVAEYLKIVALSYPLMMLMQVGCTAMQAAGHTFAVIGANRPDLARSYGWLALSVGGLFMSAMGVVFFTCAPLLLTMFIGNGHQEVLTQGISVLQLVAFAQPAAAASIILSWALGGGGDTRWSLMYNLTGRMLVEIPLAYALSGVWLNLGLYGAWLALVVNTYSLRFGTASSQLLGSKYGIFGSNA